MEDGHKNLIKRGEAISTDKKSFKIKLSALGHNHLDVTELYEKIGDAYKNQNKHEEAIPFMRNHSISNFLFLAIIISKSYNLITTLERSTIIKANTTKLFLMYEKSRKIQFLILGYHHPDYS
ncbi:hypothetical protein TrispH2_011368 [Trichoplax sp. H2]|nr:hypothetical protein TrispH2_011368 [Trichoplax sp. H2]|eukprot:RDD37018.1 hypothetical protein TrispH2_011368 [Trichoplax sp. H2]